MPNLVGVPTFCRHNRFTANCPICREPEPPASARRTPRASSPGVHKAAGGGTGTRRRRAGTSGAMRVRHVARAADDGYGSSLVPGLRASADAERLAEEIGFATGRLAALAMVPTGTWLEAGAMADAEEGLVLAVQTAVLGPLAGDAPDPFAGVRALRDGALGDVVLGPRGAVSDLAAARRLLEAQAAWAARAGSQAAALNGDVGWTPQRRFERIFERLGSLPGFARAARYDLLVVLGRLGLVELEATSLQIAVRDDTTIAAKRVFGIGDRHLLERRAAELAVEAEVPIAALDLALVNFDRPPGAPRIAQGAPEDVADTAAAQRVAAALGV